MFHVCHQNLGAGRVKEGALPSRYWGLYRSSRKLVLEHGREKTVSRWCGLEKE